MNLKMILASDDKNGIGKVGDLPWRLKEDMKYFQEITVLTQDKEKINAVIMGEKTWKSIPEKYRPLPGRLNLVLSRNPDFRDEGCVIFDSIDSCISHLRNNNSIESTFVTGGGIIYNQFLNNPDLKKIYHTKVYGDFACDVFYDGIPDSFELESESELKEDKGIQYKFQIYKKD